MRVLMVDAAGFSPPYDYSLAGALQTAGVNIDLIEPPEMRKAWTDHDAVIETPRFRRLSRAAKGMAYVARMRALLQQVDECRPDVVHFQWLAIPAVDGRVIRRLKGKTSLVFTMHNTSLFHGAASSGLQGWNIDSVYAQFDRIVVHSEYGRQGAMASGRARAEQLVRIPHGAFSHYAELSPPAQARRDGPTRLLFVGSIKPYKGLDVLIRALAVLRAQVGSGAARLVVAGHPSMSMEPLRALATAEGVDDLIDWQLRHLTERELAAAMADCHAVVLPYREIDQSGVLLAAVAMCRTVVASAIGGVPEVITHEQNGLLVAPDHPVELGNALSRIVLEPELRTRCEQRMRALAEGELSWPRVAQSTIDLYNSLHR